MALQKAERLVSTAARAFYTDIAVLVVDTLIREKCVSRSRRHDVRFWAISSTEPQAQRNVVGHV